MEPDLAKCLNDAADLIETLGLAKEAYEAYGGAYNHKLGRYSVIAYCTVGAIRAACPDNLRKLGEETAYDLPVAKLLGFKDLQKVFTWNDRKKRTKAEVVACLRLGSERARLGASSSLTSGSSG